jgi:PAS domain S-box-containing protein
VYDATMLREILDAQLDMVCRFTREGRILFVNRAYAQTLGKSVEELTGSNLWGRVSAEDRLDVERQLSLLGPDHPQVIIENRLETAQGPRWTLWRNAAVSFGPDGYWDIAQSTGFDITERKQLEEQRQLLQDELNHRVRNTLMVVQGMAYQSFRGDDVPQAALSAFNARLHALAGAHTVLSRSNWTGAEMADVVHHGLAICGQDMARIKADGPPLNLRPAVAVALVLVLHELATNAVKYGSLSNHAGQVAIGWTLDDSRERLTLDWAERAGPPVPMPVERGFGSRLIETSITRQLAGEVDVDYAVTGLTCRMALPLGAAA